MTGHSTSVLVHCSCFGFRPSPIPPKRGTYYSHLLFGPCLLWPNGRQSQLLLGTCIDCMWVAWGHLQMVIVSSKWCGSSVAQFVKDSWVLDLTRPILLLLTLANTACANEVVNFIAPLMKNGFKMQLMYLLVCLCRTQWRSSQHGQNLHSWKSHKNVAWTFCARG